MDDGGAREVFAETMIRECVALGVTLALVWAIGPGRVLVPAWIARVKALWRPGDAHAGQVRQFAAEVSRWDHEQASRQDRRAAKGGGCGCW